MKKFKFWALLFLLAIVVDTLANIGPTCLTSVTGALIAVIASN